MDRSAGASSPRVLRRLNAQRILEYAWGNRAFTASDVMSSTGLTRSTVIGVCDELVHTGWLIELSDARAVGDYQKGRPARRYSLHDDAAVVVGVDAGYDHMSATVADLRGRTLGRADVPIPASTPQSIDRLADAEERRALARRVVDEALASAAIAPGRVLALTVGVPAPVDADGKSPAYDTGFWRLMNPGLGQIFAGSAPFVTVENDANLAAIAERSSAAGRGRDVDSYIALLVGEGIGAGLMIDRRLIRGRRGGAGEMRFLDHVEGVGSPNGLALLARLWATDAILSGDVPAHSGLGLLDPESLDEGDVARAAESGDAAAAAILERLAARLAQICFVLGDLLDVDRIVVGGSVVESLPAVIQRADAILAASDDPTAPELVASALGAAAVGAGAVEHALSLVRDHAFELFPVTSHVA
ncbi:MAG TPA: ROK family protein [Glaciibacter sp.]|nr:ROK family protein [Glaciibacter sp.]